MEHLSIENFLVIKKAEMDIKKINLLIGPQASGKSVIAKLVYFFREFLDSTYLQSIQDDSSKKNIQKAGLDSFEKYFPKYTWNDKDFEIKYQVNEFEVSVSKLSGKQASIKLDYSPKLMSLHKQLKALFKEKLRLYEEGEKLTSQFKSKYRDPFWDLIIEHVYTMDIGKNFTSSLFIPAGRSFFANLQENVFTFLAGNIDIDPFIINFGHRYQNAKRIYERELYLKTAESDLESRKKVDKLAQDVLVGKYKYEDEKDWIESKKTKVNLSNASSGQQESLPMLLVLSTWPFRGRRNKRFTFFIEEPEAHLFPVSQKYIVSIFALIYKTRGSEIFITTHSPYILTAINNLILANDIALQKGEKAISKLVDPQECISFEDVSAYTLEKGELVSIMNEEDRLIGSSIIDSVSDEFDHVFDSLLKIQMGK